MTAVASSPDIGPAAGAASSMTIVGITTANSGTVAGVKSAATVMTMVTTTTETDIRAARLPGQAHRTP